MYEILKAELKSHRFYIVIALTLIFTINILEEFHGINRNRIYGVSLINTNGIPLALINTLYFIFQIEIKKYNDLYKILPYKKLIFGMIRLISPIIILSILTVSDIVMNILLQINCFYNAYILFPNLVFTIMLLSLFFIIYDNANYLIKSRIPGHILLLILSAFIFLGLFAIDYYNKTNIENINFQNPIKIVIFGIMLLAIASYSYTLRRFY